MADPDWDRCHSCFSIRTSPAAAPSSIVADVTASQTPEICGPAAAEPAFAVACRRAAHPAAHPMDAIARATFKKPTKPERIRTKTLPALYPRVYTIKIGPGGRRATAEIARRAWGRDLLTMQSIGGWCRLI